MYDALYFLNVFKEATIIFNISSPSLYNSAILSLLFLLNSTINSKKKRDSSVSYSTILNLSIKSAFDLARLVAL